MVPYVLVLVGALVVALAGVGLRSILTGDDPPAASGSTGTGGPAGAACKEQSELRVVAAPEIVAAVRAAGSDLTATACVHLSVTGAAGDEGLRLVSEGRADAWVPDSSTWVDLTGTSGHPASPHYSDQLSTWAAGRQFPWPFSAAATQADARSRLTLQPSA